MRGSTRAFASQTLQMLGGRQGGLDYLLLNAGITDGAGKEGTKGPGGSRWCEALVVNHLCEWTGHTGEKGEGGIV